MTRDEARAVTEQIRGALLELWGLLLETYEGAAWSPLGYASWREYATTEFGISKSRAYQLLDLARVERALREAAGCPDLKISEAEARDLKPCLEEVTGALQAATLLSGTNRLAADAAREVVTAKRQALAKPRRPEPPLVAEEVSQERDPEAHLRLPVADLAQHQANLRTLTGLYRAMDGLSRMPPAVDVAQEIAWTPSLAEAVEAAARWLEELAEKAPPPAEYPMPRRYDEECRRLEEYCAQVDDQEVLRRYDDVAHSEESGLAAG